MYYLLITILIFIGLLIYFKIANRYNIIDKPNERSSHTQITIRGGGIVYPLSYALLIFFSFDKIDENYLYIIIGLGLLIISTISFVDDIVLLSPKLRLIFHFISVSVLLYSISGFSQPLWIILLYYIFVIGILNCFNFMDGINGITGLYSLITLCTLYYINTEYSFFSKDFILFPIIASCVFLFFNFRKKARCFAGDIGSFSIAYLILVIIGTLIIQTGDYRYLFLLTVYGVDSVLTIIERIFHKENIFEAHRKHLYQILVNEKKQSHLLISFWYAFIQLIINFVILYFDFNFIQCVFAIVLPFGLLYLLLKSYLKKNIILTTNKTI